MAGNHNKKANFHHKSNDNTKGGGGGRTKETRAHGEITGQVREENEERPRGKTNRASPSGRPFFAIPFLSVRAVLCGTLTQDGEGQTNYWN